MLRFFGRGSAFSDQQNSSYFEYNNDLILIDCPMDTFDILKKWDLTNYKHIYILVTHTHGDHISGIGMLVDYLYFLVNIPVTIVAPCEGVRKDLKYLLFRLEGCNDFWYELISCEDLDKPWFNCSIATKHSPELEGKCFGYNLKIQGNNVVYTGDTNTLKPYMKYLSEGTYFYCEASAHRSNVHLYYEELIPKLKEIIAMGVKVYLMHMDDEKKVLGNMKDLDVKPAPLVKEVILGDNSMIMNEILQITDSLYKDMCMNGSKDHNLLFSYLTELAKTIVDADRASLWKWDKRRRQIWTMSATGVDKLSIPDNTGLVGKALKYKKTIITNDPYNDPDFNYEIDIKTGYKTKSVLVMPVADINGNFIGALQLINKKADGGFDAESDSRKLSLAALICGIALESETFLEDSHHDKLTGLKNRMGFYYDFGGKYKDYLIPESGKVMSVFISDIDKFKSVNDTYGHNAGDDVLRFASQLLESACGENDSLYRWGGEEFVMVMREKDLDGAVQKAEEMRLKLMGSDINADGNMIKCTMSFGCAVFDPSKTIEENISIADERLYTAKETGRNRVCFE